MRLKSHGEPIEKEKKKKSISTISFVFHFKLYFSRSRPEKRRKVSRELYSKSLPLTVWGELLFSNK